MSKTGHPDKKLYGWISHQTSSPPSIVMLNSVATHSKKNDTPKIQMTLILKDSTIGVTPKKVTRSEIHVRYDSES